MFQDVSVLSRFAFSLSVLCPMQTLAAAAGDIVKLTETQECLSVADKKRLQLFWETLPTLQTPRSLSRASPVSYLPGNVSSPKKHQLQQASETSPRLCPSAQVKYGLLSIELVNKDKIKGSIIVQSDAIPFHGYPVNKLSCWWVQGIATWTVKS